MKLRLDEMVPVRVARELRSDGYDVDAVVESRGLRGLSDALQLARAAADGRAFVSYDAGDLIPLAAQLTASREGHAGLVLLRSSRFPQGSPETAASESINGTPRADRIFADTGNDTVDGLAGNDCIDARDGQRSPGVGVQPAGELGALSWIGVTP